MKNLKPGNGTLLLLMLQSVSPSYRSVTCTPYSQLYLEMVWCGGAIGDGWPVAGGNLCKAMARGGHFIIYARCLHETMRPAGQTTNGPPPPLRTHLLSIIISYP